MQPKRKVPGVLVSGFAALLPPEIHLTMLLVGGLAVLIVFLAWLVITFWYLDLTNTNFARGLPEGTVRALIALSLIIVFVMGSLFLFGNLEPATRSKRFPIELADGLEDRIVSITLVDDETAEVVLTKEASEASIRFANQMLTTVSTLVVAVSGFYFGTRAATAGKGTEATSQPVIRRVTPAQGGLGVHDLTISGKGFAGVKTVRLSNGMDFEATEVKSSATEITCKIEIKKGVKAGKFDLVVIFDDGGEHVLAEAFEVT